MIKIIFYSPDLQYLLLLRQNARVNLEETLPGTRGGQSPTNALLVKLLVLLPFVILAFGYYRSYLQVSFLFWIFYSQLNAYEHTSLVGI